MTEPAQVFQVSETTDGSYPRLLTAHPRNRGIGWTEFSAYTRTATPTNEVRFDLFVTASHEFDLVSVAGVRGRIISQRLRDVLEPLVGGPATFLPVAVNGHPFWVMRIEHVVDALDGERSQFHTSV